MNQVPLACCRSETSFTGLYIINQQYQGLVLASRSMSKPHRADSFYLVLCRIKLLSVSERMNNYISVPSFNSFLFSCAFDVFSLFYFLVSIFCLNSFGISTQHFDHLLCDINVFYKKTLFERLTH